MLKPVWISVEVGLAVAMETDSRASAALVDGHRK
jgi:hypothetical protein